MRIWWILVLMSAHRALSFWDIGTTTVEPVRTDTMPRQSFFRWQIVQFERLAFWFSHWDWHTLRWNRKMSVIAGLSIDFLPLGTATILNARTLITSANFLEPYLDRQKDVRIWALGRGGTNKTPYRYRVWRFRRVLPKSLNPEHGHGPRGYHVSRHDVMIVHSFDQIYIYPYKYHRYFYATRALLAKKTQRLYNSMWFAGSGFEYMEHIQENYKIYWGNQTRDEVVDCSRYLPKWWGKFICFINTHNYAGVPNGGGLFLADWEDLLIGLGCFEIRYNNERIMVFTDLRYYMDLIDLFANISYGEYYEYAYPQWSVHRSVHGWYDSMENTPYMPMWQHIWHGKPYGKR